MAKEYWGHDSTRVMQVAVLAVFSFFATVAIAFRLWARKIQRSRYELNDYLAIAGLVWALALPIFTIHSNVYWRLGADMTQRGNPQAVLHLVMLQVQALIAGQILWVTAVFFIRASILCLYTRIFRKKSFRVTCYIVHGINFANFASVVLAALLICRPISAAWTRKGTCGDQKALDLYIGVFNLLMDVCTVVLPMPVLWQLQMSKGKKLVLTGIFGMGVIICAVTIARIWITSLIHGQNAQRQYSLIALLTCLEALLGVINTCLPVMKPVFTKFGDSKLWTSVSSTFSSTLFSRSSGNRPGTDNSTDRRSRHRRSNGYHRSHGSNGGANEMRSWPISSPTTNRSVDPLAPRFVDAKSASLVFGHRPSVPGSPRPPPKDPYYRPESPRWAEGKERITVRRDWDVETGMVGVEESSSVETDRKPLNSRDDRW